jgi:hypothetical protein
MGFSAPKPDPAIAQQQAAAAAEAKRNKISSITDQLSNENQIRTRLYGAKVGFPLSPLFSKFGTPPAGQDAGVTQGLRGLGQYIFTGQMPGG